MRELAYYLNQAAGTSHLDAQGAANRLAGTTNRDLVSALNALAGTTGLELAGVLNKLANTSGLGVNKAASLATFVTAPAGVTYLSGTGNATSYDNGGTITASAVLATPANTAVGDLLVAVCCSQLNSTNVTWTPAAGWTEILHTTTGRTVGMFYKAVADATALSGLASTHTFTEAGAANRMAAYLFRVRGADLTSPVAGTSTMGTGTTTTLTLPAFTSTAAGAIIGVATANASAGNGSFIVATPPVGLDLVASVNAGAFAAANTANYTLFKQTTGTSQAAQALTFSPAAAATIYGLQAAIKAA